jgi:hypothetical protein
MKQRIIIYILFFFLVSNIFPINGFTVADDIPIMKLVLITDADVYEDYGFKDLGVYYTPASLTVFHMPFILTKEKDITIEKKDLNGKIKDSNTNLDKRSPKYSYDVLAENKDYMVIDYSMTIVASTDKFNVDFVPVIGDKEYTDFAWWNSDWDYCTTWWINNNYIDSTLTNFPVLFNISSTIASKCQADGGDLRFVDSTNTTEYAYEIEEWNPAGNSFVWVNVTNVLSSAKTQVNMYYGYTLVADGWNPGGVWDSNYLCVYHMNGTGTTIIDSTGNRDGTKAGATSPTEATGQVSKAQDFESSVAADKIEADKLGALTAFTVQCWYIPESYDAAQQLIQNAADSGGGYSATGFKISRRVTNDIGFSVSNGVDDWICDFTGSSSFTGKQYFAFTYLDETYAYIYMNTTQVASDTSVTGDMPDPASAKLRLGVDILGGGGRWWADGIMDEVRISNIVRNNSYLNATFHTSNMTIGFMSADGIASNPNNFTAPSNFTATTYPEGDIYLNWTIGYNATHTYIEYNTVSSWSRGTGTLLGNITGNYITHSGTSCGIKYYYLAWSFNSTTHQFSNPVSINNISCPGNPSSSTATLFNNTWLNITWVPASYIDATVLLRKTNSFPGNPTDGTILYNGTLNYYNDSNVQSNYYYRLYSWNNTVHRFSSGLNRGWGGLSINVFDANTSNAITYWDVFISNNDGSSTYESKNNNNTLTIDIALLPYGTNTIIIINATNYTKSIYYMNLDVNTQYILNAYLQKINFTQIFLLNVVGPKTEYNTDPPVQDAKIVIQRYINASVGYEIVAILNSDANGYAYVSLESDIIYLMNISCSGYVTSVSTFIPTSAIQVYTFRLVYIGGTSVIKQWDLFNTNISFILDIVDADCGYLGNLTIVYLDVNSSTVDTDIYIYELYDGVSVLINYSHNTSNSFNLNNKSINTSRSHYVILFFNNTADFSDIKSPYTIVHDSLCVYGLPTIPSSFDERVRNIIGPAPLGVGWHTIIGAGIAIAMLLLFGPYNAGLGIIGAGLSIGLSDALFASSFPVLFVTIMPLLIAIGIIYMWIKGGSAQL